MVTPYSQTFWMYFFNVDYVIHAFFSRTCGLLWRESFAIPFSNGITQGLRRLVPRPNCIAFWAAHRDYSDFDFVNFRIIVIAERTRLDYFFHCLLPVIIISPFVHGISSVIPSNAEFGTIVASISIFIAVVNSSPSIRLSWQSVISWLP